jgi:hypothetical protein
MIGSFIKITLGMFLIGVIAFLGWQLYLYQKIEPTSQTAKACSELFCRTGTECREKIDPEHDITIVKKEPVFFCQTWISASIQGSISVQARQQK